MNTRLTICGTQEMRKPSGFTLIELLVVLTIIALLAAMLLPSLAKAKTRAAGIVCLNNLKQLNVCWHLYALDNNDFLPPNNSVADLATGNSLAAGGSWCTNYARYDAAPDGIQNGLLFKYNSSLPIYRCPADKSTVETPAGVKLSQPRWRSYNMSQSVNGWPELSPSIAPFLPTFKKFTEISHPPPTQLIVFLDVHEDSIYDSLFGIPTPKYWGSAKVWWDIPANRHSQGANLSFADGHVEFWKWRYPKVVRARFAAQAVPDQEIPDYQRVQLGIRQEF
jgi:prepilin-type N-terminal cleavage/methylation domain-containing protein/prepilin-type processing-associated H-X9-DG protein